MGPFLKVLVESRAFSLGSLRSGSAGRTRVHDFTSGDPRFVGGRGFLAARLGCRRRGKLQPFLSRAVAPDPFLREGPPPVTAGGSAGTRPADADSSWCEFLAGPATPL